MDVCDDGHDEPAAAEKTTSEVIPFFIRCWVSFSCDVILSFGPMASEFFLTLVFLSAARVVVVGPNVKLR
ncbi:hypothetical protein OUZ56_020194 [Daphnia magna]|uniref:Uncharacterized protein n=1 Tax=Daphnia magna TaxID=35525 RepID=A0ABQ9ZDT9_9CRUS|nr:hypothetical protein OUZ56_020194 [Daphnia magna]